MRTHPLLLLPLLAPAGLAESQHSTTERVQRNVALMGTSLSLVVEAESRPVALAASERAVQAIEATETRLSTWRKGSELSRLSRAPVGVRVPLSPALSHDLLRARELWQLTSGAFDPGVGALANAWGLHDGGRRPADEELAACLAAGGFSALELGDGFAVRHHARLGLDAGGFGKGVGLDAALRALKEAGVSSAVLDFGGQVAVLSGSQTFSIADPRDRSRAVVGVELTAGSFATSGNSERGIVIDGVAYGHLLDPRTGTPADDFGSVTAWASDATTADALSTGFFVLGPEAALALAERLPGVEALVLEVSAEGLSARATSGLRGRIEPMVQDLLVEFPAPPAQPALLTSARAEQAALKDDELLQRVERLEAENREQALQIEVLTEETERFELRDVMPAVGESVFGMGPAASKVYAKEQGLSIGGYGEFVYTDHSGTKDDVFDALRAVTYIGYKFTDKWLFNSELEIEHGTTSSSSGTTSSDGSSSLEFGYLDYLHSENLNLRGGLVLVPVGLVNELHEPTSFLPASRPQTENRIIPTTWRENGIGAFGDAGGFEYKAFVVNGLSGKEFDATGLRGGRQKGNRAAAEDLALALRLDWVETPGLIVGGSVYRGDSGQDAAGIPDLGTTIVEAHVQYENGPWVVRALAAHADVDDAREFNMVTTENLAEELRGHYVELGYELCTDGEHSLVPFVRYEDIDTQASLPSGFSSLSEQGDEIVTFGINYKPIDQVVLKLDYEDWDGRGDRWNFLIGYVF